jgi:hypothetical protein
MKKETQIIRDGFTVRKKKKRNINFSFEIGGLDANLNKDMLRNKKLVIALQDVAETLMKQLDCDGIILNSIKFQRMWQR